MHWLLKMKLRNAALIVFVIFVITCAVIAYFQLTEELNEHHFVVSEEKHYDTEVIEDIPEDNDDQTFYQGMEDRLTELDDGVFHDFEVDRVVPPVLNALKHAEKQELPILIWWTPFTGDQEKIKKCWEGSCLFTQNQTFYSHSLAKGFLFYGTDFHESKVPLPRKAHHEWALLHEESPKNQALYFYADTLELFNHTATFKQQSSYPISTQYVKSRSYILKPLQYTVQAKNQMKKDEDLASIVYIQSGCNPPSDRDAYIQELMKYVKIDAYGKCLHNRDLPEKYKSPMKMHSKGFIEILQKYKFMISFENGICDDYITEKLYRTLNVGSVPIYKGAPNVRQWLPDDHSAIIVDDYKTPKELAKYIKLIDNNDEEYNKYLAYKETGILNKNLNDTLTKRQWGVDSMYKMSFITGFECHVCDQIHRNKKLIAKGEKPVEHIADISHYGCPAPKNYDFPSIPGAEDWERETWLWEYNDAGKKSKELKEKVLKSMEN